MLFSVCCETFFTERSLAEKLAIFAKNDFHMIELWSWRDKDLPELFRSVDEFDLKVTAFSGQRKGSLFTPAGMEVYLKDLAEGINVAKQLRCDKLMLLTTELAPDGSVLNQYGTAAPGTEFETVLQNLKKAVALAEKEQITLLLEPLNTLVDHPGYYPDSSAEAIRLVEAVGSPYLKVLYDVYHMQIMGEDPITTIKKQITKIGYFHIADVPGRHEPGTGGIDFHAIFQILETIRYNGVIGIDCFPSQDSLVVLRKIKEFIAEFE